jgi:hypothetical protein
MSSYRKNPFIENYLSQLVAKKKDVDSLDEEQINRLVEGLYTRFESMLGRNIVEYLPEEERKNVRKKLTDIRLEKDDQAMESVSAILDQVDMAGIDFPALLKETLQELTEEYLGR